ncbi:hypothetical protein C0J52_27280 [Blattella germanica]|nr:hypothetical protein C0J52_27280 [Blattella germanica]
MPFHLLWCGPVFTVKSYWKNYDSYEAARQEFRRHFQLGRHDPVPTKKNCSNVRDSSSSQRRHVAKSTAFSTATCGIIGSISTHSEQNIVSRSQIATIQIT